MTPESAERAERVRALVDAGLTAQAIGERLGISRSAVLGIVHRNRAAWGLARRPTRRPKVSARGGAETAAVRPEPGRGREKPGQPIEDAPGPAVREGKLLSPGVGAGPPAEGRGRASSAGVWFADRERGQCPFPLWDSWAPLPMADELMVCGDPVADGEDEVYCPVHRALCWTPAPGRIERLARLGRSR